MLILQGRKYSRPAAACRALVFQQFLLDRPLKNESATLSRTDTSTVAL